MNDKELADRVVALGVGGIMDNRTGDGKEYYEMRKFEHGVWTFAYMLEASEFVRDGRVAVALMDKCHAIFIEKLSDEKWSCRADKACGERTRAWHDHESLPRAITEACVKAWDRAEQDS